MKNAGLIVSYTILLAAQIVLTNFAGGSQLLLINILPCLIMCLPVNSSTVKALILAFFFGFMVDFLGDGALGLSSAALMLVAVLRRPILLLVSREEIFSHRDTNPTSHQSTPKNAITQAFAALIFFTVYVIIDCAGMRSFLFCLARIVISTAASAALAAIVGLKVLPKNY